MWGIKRISGASNTISLSGITIGSTGLGTYTPTYSVSGGSLLVSFVNSVTNYNYFDVNGTGTGSGVTNGGTYNISGPNFNTVADGSGSTSTFTSGQTATFSAGTDAAGTSYTVNVDTAVTTAGITVEEGFLTLAPGGGSLTLSTPSINVANGAAALITQAIGGSVGLTKDGSGTMTLGIANSYTGTTTMNAGILSVSNDANWGDAANTLAYNGGTLQTGAAITSARAIAINAGGGTIDTNGFDSSLSGAFSGAGNFTKAGAGALTVLGALGYTGTTAISAGSLVLAQPLTSSSQTVNLTASASGGTFLGNLVVQNGTNTVGANTYTTRVNFNGGTFSGSGQIQVQSSGATLADNTGTATIGNNIVLNSTGVAGSFVTNIGAASGGTLTIGGIISGNSDVNLAVGSAGGAGTLNLNVANTYTGATTINNTTTGLIKLGVDNALPTGTSLTFGRGTASTNVGVLDLNGKNQTIASLATNLGKSSTANGITNTASGTTSTLTINGSAATTYAAVIGKPTVSTVTGASDNIALTLAATNTGTLTLTGANTYSGGTTISGGTLKLDSAGSTTSRLAGTTQITVNNGGTLLLANSLATVSVDRINVSANVAVNSGGTFNTAGLSEGVLTNGPSPTAGLGALTLSANSTIDFMGGANGSALIFTSFAATSGTVSILNWTGTARSDDGTTTNDRLLFTNAITFSDAQLSQIQFYNDSNGLFATGATAISFGSYSELVPVPEPTTVFAALALVGFVGYRERRRLLAFSKAGVVSASPTAILSCP